jgi:F0F1-type ATP synthase membrane subunit c/vacuolar-type H+-ATPase subunit K
MASRRKREQKAAAAAAAAAQTVRKPPIVRFGLVIGVGLLALLASFILVLAFARQSGLHEQHVNYALAGAALLIGIVCTRWAKSLNKKSAERK